MEQEKVAPDVIFLLTAGAVGDRSTTYEERDAFGTLGGRVRVEAVAILAREYPHAIVVAASGHDAHVARAELVALGLLSERIQCLEQADSNSRRQLLSLFDMAKDQHWAHISIVSSDYHLPRLRKIAEVEGLPVAEYVSAESVLTAHDPEFAAKFAAVRATPAYADRLRSEAAGMAALEAGKYQPAPKDAKRERPN